MRTTFTLLVPHFGEETEMKTFRRIPIYEEPTDDLYRRRGNGEQEQQSLQILIRTKPSRSVVASEAQAA